MNRFYRWVMGMMALLGLSQLAAEISKEQLFCTPKLISAKVSPDGQKIALVGADEAGIPNVYLIPVDGQFSERVQISFFKSPDIIQFFWSPDSSKVLLLKDENGTGQLNLHGFDIHSGNHLEYTKEFPGVNVKIVQIGALENKAVVGLNHRNPHFHDLYVLDLDSGDFSLLFQNDAYAKFLVSGDLELILKMKIEADSSWTILKVNDEVLMRLSPDDAFQTEFLSYDGIKNAVYLLDNRFTNTNQLLEKRLSGEEKLLGGQSYSDVDEVLFLEGEPKAYASYYTQKKWHVIDPSVKDDIVFLEEQAGSNFEVLSQSRDGRIWVISNSIPDRGGMFWVYRRDPRSLTLLSGSSSERYSKMYEMVAESRDGKKLVCYYTLPKEADQGDKGDQGGSVDAPIPLVVVPHGGPFKVRDRFSFNPMHQWLSSLGYAVLSVNFRLSSGFGKDFVTAGNGEWGGKAHLDVIDAVEACIAKGITQHGKLAILGGSYGGYETLASLTFTPDYFTCCVSICGPSSLKTFLDFVPQYWEFTAKPLSDKNMFFTRRAFITSFGGDPATAEGLEKLKESSPLYHLDRIQAPLLLIQGKNDHIITEIEAEQIYRSMKEQGKKVAYLLFPGEGHRFAKFPNKMFYLDHAERFLSEHLHGKYRPIDPQSIHGSSGIVFN